MYAKTAEGKVVENPEMVTRLAVFTAFHSGWYSNASVTTTKQKNTTKNIFKMQKYLSAFNSLHNEIGSIRIVAMTTGRVLLSILAIYMLWFYCL